VAWPLSPNSLQLPIVEDLIQNTSTELSEEHPASKNAVLSHASPVLHIAKQLIKAIFVAVDGSNPSVTFVKHSTPQRRNSQQGDLDLVITSQTPYLSSTVSLELEIPAVAFAHGGGLREEMFLNPTREARSAAAIAIKVGRPRDG
jgi:hypothetical protein